MSGWNWQAIVAGLAIAGAAINVLIGLWLKAAMLENNRQLLEKVDREYLPRELHASYHEALVERVAKLEGRRHA